MTKFQKGSTGTYTAGGGAQFSAQVLTAHKDGSVTVRVGFPMQDGKRAAYGYQGDKYRVHADQFVAEIEEGG